MSNVLVTGGAGFIGSHVAEELIRSGYTVTVLDDLSGGFVDNIPEGSEFVKGSIQDAELISSLFKVSQFKYVFHLAAYAAEGLSHFIKRYNYNNNLIGSVNLINASINHQVRCFVFTSSIAVYGSSEVLPLTEDTQPRPEDPYGIAKFAVEQELSISQKLFGLDYIIFRPHNVYGEKQNIADRYRNVVGIFMNQVMKGEPMTVFGDGTQTRAFSYIADVAPIIVLAIENPRAYNHIFNIGADEPYSVNELAVSIAASMGVEPRIEHLPPRNEVKDAYSSHDKLRRFFGNGHSTDLDAGLSRMAAWAQRHGARSSTAFKEVEIEKNMPACWREVTAGASDR